MFKGWDSHVHRTIPGKFESSNVSRDNVSREIGRTPMPVMIAEHAPGGSKSARRKQELP